MSAKNIKLPIKYNKKSTIDSMLRVDHAGEYGAKRIYEGQLAVTKDPRTRKLIEEMYNQELKHLNYFENKMVKRQSRPTLMQPLWHVGGFALGAITGFIGPKAAMLCTKAVEEIIANHYQQQINTLNEPEFNDEQELRETLIKFREEELDHKDIAEENKADQAFGSVILSGLIQNICKFAIKISKEV